MSDEIVNAEKKALVKFDLSRLTAKQVTEFTEAARVGDLLQISEIFAALVVECPTEWGAVNDPQTYFNRPVFAEFRPMMAQLIAEVKGDSKN